MTTRHSGGKLLSLEGLRGIAALVVMCGHLVRGLVPPAPGPLTPLNLVHQWVLNGGASVTIFFVLSGFILSLPFAKDRSRERIVIALLKRWPRLVGVTVAACLVSWALIMLSHGANTRAAALTGNYWMASHFNAPLQGQDVSLWGALYNGLVGVFLFGDVHFDSPMWTMRVELFGSLGIYLVAPLLFALRRWPLRLVAVAVGMLAAGVTAPYTYFSDFLVGAVLAMLLTEGRWPVLSGGQAVGLGVAAVYLYCFSAGPVPWLYAPLKALLPGREAAHYVWEMSAALFMLVLIGSAGAQRVFGRPWAVRLGELSFPLYVLHVPVMLSAGAACVVAMAPVLGLSGAVLLAAVVTIALTLAGSVPLAWVDKAWTGMLNRATALLVKRFTSPMPGA